jgi:hypothetical protein
MLKLATDVERAHAHELVCSEVAKIMEMDRSNDNRSLQSVAAASPSPPPHKKFKSYKTLFEDADYGESNNNMPSSIRARRELETYLQLKLMNCTYGNNENDDPLLFWKEQNHILPNLSKLAKKIFCIRSSSAQVERAFSSAGVVISQRRTNINPSMVNDIILVRSTAAHSKSHI